MEGIKVIELPKCKMVSSGCSTEQNPFEENGLLMKFSKWWSAIDAQRKDKFFSRDFMWYDREAKGLVWYYAITDEMAETGGFDVVDYEGGLYASAVSKDGDEADGERVYRGIQNWIKEGDCFEINEYPGHYDMFHIVTSEAGAKALGYHQLEIFVPIKPRAV